MLSIDGLARTMWPKTSRRLVYNVVGRILTVRRHAPSLEMRDRRVTDGTYDGVQSVTEPPRGWAP